ncbi:hypothetical protein CP533_2685 [Ophiocordyceps camponoti-saundersi (nom. inval.)]|nr:hypothetical protein CP533_2685 [Ophiocordyceps camponoti-saundersi (nom. inval.)]
MHFFSVISAELLLISLATAIGSLGPLPLPIRNSTSLPPRGHPWTSGLFRQYINHKNHSLGTFDQRFWWNTDHWGGPGSPILFQAPGESGVDPQYLRSSPRYLEGLLAETNKAALIALEHRYFGESLPFGKKFGVEEMQYLTLENAIEDLIHFANSVVLPFDRNGSSKPQNAPWIISGCSYSGALAAWINVLSPGTFWAYHCGSAVVEAISDLSGYNGQVEKAMPRNCSADMKRVAAHFDQVLGGGTSEERSELGKMFNVPSNSSDGDYASVLSNAIGTWQNVQFTSGHNNFTIMCDYVENQWPGSNSSVPGADGVGTKRAVEGLSRWTRDISSELPQLDKDSQTAWNWFLCNEPFEWWPIAGPDDGGIVPKALTRDYFLQSCYNMFPAKDKQTFGIAKGHTVEQVNAKTGGWNKVNTTRLLWVNGELDPWLPATVSSEKRPGGPLKSTKEVPVWVIPKGSHCNEIKVANADVNEGARRAITGVDKQMKEWVNEFYELHGKTRT